ncbi:aminopeptidase [Paenibacillus caui]|uniref:aminopeptidase n=1 Tax=Paenibacillus caui TaxID=2873927 RepID=UPI001CAA272B|nr:aminopeptidase [Paenibacillus caui]
MNAGEFYQHLTTYADLIVSVGLNLHEGEKVKINFHSESIDLVRLIAESAYKRGASTVALNFRDSRIEEARASFLHEQFLDTFPAAEVENHLNFQHSGYSEITILAPFTNSHALLDEQRIQRMNRAKSIAMKPVRQYGMENHNKWVIVNYATREWATTVYPDLEDAAALAKLWKVIFSATKVFEDEPIEAWQQHDRQLKNVQHILNAKKFKSLKFVSDETNLTIGLVKNHLWIGGSEITKGGEPFMSNMPVEEIWTMPDSRQVDGYFTMTKPSNINGILVHELRVHFNQGKIVKISSDKPEIMSDFLNTDEGASRLGEVALVPANTPIDKANVNFNNTLLDENAAIHLAFGQAYMDNIQDGFALKEDELKQLGMNFSSAHQDIMFGSSTMDVFGIHSDGTEEIIMQNGVWKV